MKKVELIFNNLWELILGGLILLAGLFVLNDPGQIALWLWHFIKSIFGLHLNMFYDFVQGAKGFAQIIGGGLVLLGGLDLVAQILDLVKNVCFFKEDA